MSGHNLHKPPPPPPTPVSVIDDNGNLIIDDSGNQVTVA
jgi:hypothetical protein